MSVEHKVQGYMTKADFNNGYVDDLSKVYWSVQALRLAQGEVPDSQIVGVTITETKTVSQSEERS